MARRAVCQTVYVPLINPPLKPSPPLKKRFISRRKAMAAGQRRRIGRVINERYSHWISGLAWLLSCCTSWQGCCRRFMKRFMMRFINAGSLRCQGDDSAKTPPSPVFLACCGGKGGMEARGSSVWRFHGICSIESSTALESL